MEDQEQDQEQERASGLSTSAKRSQRRKVLEQYKGKKGKRKKEQYVTERRTKKHQRCHRAELVCVVRRGKGGSQVEYALSCSLRIPWQMDPRSNSSKSHCKQEVR
jgi:hypothetical protein